jgi:hypothetical protein
VRPLSAKGKAKKKKLGGKKRLKRFQAPSATSFQVRLDDQHSWNKTSTIH